MKEIKLRNGKVTLVSDEDFERYNQYSWNESKGYVFGTIDGISKPLHRFILNLSDPKQIGDHINGDPLDNRRENLRVVSRQQNTQNRFGLKGAISRYKGVSLNKSTGRWYARLGNSGTVYSLGTFDTEEEAAMAYNRKAIELSPYIKLNSVDMSRESKFGKKCKQCKADLKGRLDQRFCSANCRGTFNSELRRLKKKKIDFIKKLEEAKNLPSEYPQEVLELFNKLKEGGRYGV